MIQLFAMPSRQYVNETFHANVFLSDWVDVSTCGGILVRFEIESGLDIGESVIFTHSLFNSGVYMGGATRTFTANGRYEVGFGRGDFDNTTTVDLTLQVIGRLRANAVAYSIAKGEDVLEWL
jgi:hypothetical protein